MEEVEARGGTAAGVYGSVGLPGEADNMTTAVRKQTRAAVGMMILSDPSLSVEDKVMICVLRMTIFADDAPGARGS